MRGWDAAALVVALGCGAAGCPGAAPTPSPPANGSSTGSDGGSTTAMELDSSSDPSTTTANATSSTTSDAADSTGAPDCEPGPSGTPESAWFLHLLPDGMYAVGPEAGGEGPGQQVFAAPPGQTLHIASGWDAPSIAIRSSGVGDDSLWVARTDSLPSFTPVKIDVAPAPDAQSTFASISAQGDRAVFDAATAPDGARSLYITDLQGPPLPSLLVAPTSPQGTITVDFRFTPDGAWVVFVADLDGNGQSRRYQISATAGPGQVPRDLGPVDPTESSLDDDEGQYVVLRRATGLFLLDLTGADATAPVPLSDPVPADGFSSLLGFSGTYDWIGHLASEPGREVVRTLYDLSTPNPRAMVLPPDLRSAQGSPLGSRLVYARDADVVALDMQTWPPSPLALDPIPLAAGYDRIARYYPSSPEDTFYVVDTLGFSGRMYRVNVATGAHTLLSTWDDSPQLTAPLDLLDGRVALFWDFANLHGLDADCPLAVVPWTEPLSDGGIFYWQSGTANGKMLLTYLQSDDEGSIIGVRFYELDVRRDGPGEARLLVDLANGPLSWALLPAPPR